MPIPFKVFCEWATCGQQYSWFYFDKSMTEHLEKEDFNLVRIEPLSLTDTYCRIWYPASKYIASSRDKVNMLDQMRAAIERSDFDEVMKIKKQMKELGI